MSQTESARDLAFAIRAITSMSKNMNDAISLEQLLETGFGPRAGSRNFKLHSKFGDTTAAIALEMHNRLYAKEITLCITRILDRAGDERASLGEVFRRLKKPETLAALEDYCSAERELQKGRETRPWLSEIEAAYLDLRDASGKEDVKKLFDARHSLIAHSLLKTPVIATYNALFATVFKTAAIVAELNKLIGLDDTDFEPHRQNAQVHAEAYWDALLDGKVSKLDF